ETMAVQTPGRLHQGPAFFEKGGLGRSMVGNGLTRRDLRSRGEKPVFQFFGFLAAEMKVGHACPSVTGLRSQQIFPTLSWREFLRHTFLGDLGGINFRGIGRVVTPDAIQAFVEWLGLSGWWCRRILRLGGGLLQAIR